LPAIGDLSMIRFVWLLFLFLLCYYLLGALGGVLKRRVKPVSPEKSEHGEDMVRDPCCGTFVPRSLAVRQIVKGKRYYFCSKQCRDQFLRSNK
jgi:YHS domain-containing protein